jgi:hypothetical protein
MKEKEQLKGASAEAGSGGDSSATSPLPLQPGSCPLRLDWMVAMSPIRIDKGTRAAALALPIGGALRQLVDNAKWDRRSWDPAVRESGCAAARGW